MRKKHKKQIIYPYLFALVIFAFFLLIAPGFYLTSDWIRSLFCGHLARDELYLLITAWSMPIAYVVLCFIGGYYWLGLYELRKDAIIITSPLRRKIKIAFSDVKYIGLDYRLLQDKPQFWIYISKVPIPKKYQHKITNLLSNRSTVLILYTPERFAEFISILPPHLSKELQKGVSMLRKFKVDTSIDK